MKMTFERLQRKISSGDIGSALSEIQELEQTARTSPRLLVLKAMCLQLSPDDGPLEDVESALQAALSIDDEYVDAYLELGWFFYAVQDRPTEAQVAFDKALQLLRKLNHEVIRGLLACAEDLSPEANPETSRTRLEELLLSPPATP